MLFIYHTRNSLSICNHCLALVQKYYELVGGFSKIEVERHVDKQAPWFRRGHDPLFVVLGTRASES